MKIFVEGYYDEMAKPIIKDLRSQPVNTVVTIHGYYISRRTPWGDDEIFETTETYKKIRYSQPGYISGEVWQKIGGNSKMAGDTALAQDIVMLYSSKESAEADLSQSDFLKRKRDGGSYTFTR